MLTEHAGTLPGRAGVEGNRAGEPRLRRAGTATVRRWSPQDDRNAARRRLATHLGHRVRVHRRRSALRFDDRRPQGSGSQAGSPLRPARPGLPSEEGKESAWPGEAKIAGHAIPAGPVVTDEASARPDGEMFVADITEVVITGLNTEATKLVIESWTSEQGLRRVERD